MALPSGHLWQAGPPVTKKGFKLIGAMGASNLIGEDAIDKANKPEQNQYNNTNFEKKISHLDAIIDYSDPVNKSNSSNYNDLNEDGGYSYMTRLMARLREYWPHKIAAVVGGQSATPLATGSGGWYNSRNASNPSDMTTRYGQMITRINRAQTLTGTKMIFMCTNMAGRDAAIGVLPSYWESQYKSMVDDIRADTSNPNLVFINIGLGPLPPTLGSNYSQWTGITNVQPNLDQKTGVYNITYGDAGIIFADDINQTDEVHKLSTGQNKDANAIISKLSTIGII